MNTNQSTTEEEHPLEIVSDSALEALTRGEIDMQISTAKRFPRSLAKFKARAIEMVQTDQATAESCIYVRPVGKDENGKMKYAEGLSIRMAEIVTACYGNMRSGAILSARDDRSVTARGFAHDLETNNFVAWEVTEPTVTRSGRPYSESQRNVVGKAALAKAQRDAIFKVVPKALCKAIENEARKMIHGDAQSFDERKANAIEWVKRLKIDDARVWAVLDILGPADIRGEHLMTLIGIKNAIRDNETSIDDAFPAIIPQGNIGKTESGPPQKTATELAAEEAKAKADAEESKADKKPEKKGQKAEDLLKTLFDKAAEMNIGKSLLLTKLTELKIVAPGKRFQDLDAEQLDRILEAWEEIKSSLA